MYDENRIRRILNSLPRRRHFGIQAELPNGLAFLFYDEEHFISARYVLDNLDVPPIVSLVVGGKDVDDLSSRFSVKFVPLSHIMRQVHKQLVICTHEAAPRRVWEMAAVALRRGYNSYSLSKPLLIDRRPRLLENRLESIIEIVNRLADEESVLIYLARLKALITGDTSYIRSSAFDQYRHPAVHVEEGDIVLDAGVGDMVRDIVSFSEDAGPNGRVYSFEPIASLSEKASAQIQHRGNAEIINAGFWSEETEATIQACGNASTLQPTEVSEGASPEACRLTTIDAFIARKNIRPQFIKMDIEGAERFALAGGASYISEAKPKLAICIYHSVDDFFYLPDAVNKLNGNYKFYVGNHSPYAAECVLYAVDAAKQGAQ